MCVAVVFVSKCDGAARKKRNTQEDVTLEFTLPLDDQAIIDLQAMYDTNTGESNISRRTTSMDFAAIIPNTSSGQ